VFLPPLYSGSHRFFVFDGQGSGGTGGAQDQLTVGDGDAASPRDEVAAVKVLNATA
jgi:hypothetical protein